MDESIYFPNARFLEAKVNEMVALHPEVKHFILMCSAVNSIDASGLESLKSINQSLSISGITFHLSEVKGPVMDRLNRSHLPEHLTGQIHLTHFDAVSSIRSK
jgi:SulP family sulfate permease